jgi:FdhD protein
MSIRAVDVVRVDRRGRRAPARDRTAVEEPLQVRVNGEPFAVIMRTPGADRDLTAGFLFSEGVVAAAADIARMEAAPNGHGPAHNVLDVTVAGPGATPRVARRLVTTGSSCGLCGRQTIESLTVRAPRLAAAWTIAAAVVAALPARMREAQRAFDATGGLHAAALFDRHGALDLVAEDIGRHNAVDKVVGRKLTAGALPLAESLLCVSGRSSYEIVQKAFLAGIPALVAVSAPSSLAVELADEGGLTLIGFARDGRFNIYTHPERVTP